MASTQTMSMFPSLLGRPAHGPLLKDRSFPKYFDTRSSQAMHRTFSGRRQQPRVSPDSLAILDREFVPEFYPPLPENLPTIELETISLAKLETGDHVEQDRLFEICKDRGFFYLDFTNSSAASLPSDGEEIVRVAEEIFKLPLEEKKQYLPQRPQNNYLFGYKNAGRTVTDRNGTPDTAEFFNISKNDLVSTKPNFPWPAQVHANKSLLSSYACTAHSISLNILSILATKLNLPADTFSRTHRLTEPSGDHVRMTRGPPRKDIAAPEIQTPGHTDSGTVTILLNWLGGLQIWSDSCRGENFENVVDPDIAADTSSNSLSANQQQPGWLYVRPKPNHAIINLGDAAVKLTDGLFCSGRHRVVPAPGQQGLFPRYSLVYFVRPEDGAVLKSVVKPDNHIENAGYDNVNDEEEPVTAKEWIAQQAKKLEGR